VGVSRVVTFPHAVSGLTIPESLSTAAYLIVVSNLNTANDQQYTYTVSGTASDQLTFPPPLSDQFPARSMVVPPTSLSPAEQFEWSVRARERSTLRMNPLGRQARRTIIPGSAVNDLNIGDKVSIHVNGVTGDGCTNQPVTTGVVKYISQHAIFVLDSAAPGNGTVAGQTFTSTDFQAIGDDFDNTIFATDTSYFGAPSDYDANGKIIIYYTPQVNELTTSGSSGRVGGFFFAGDLFPATGTNNCANSNEGEIFYLLAPDPNGVYSSAINVNQVRQLTRGTIAHEFQHMINAGNRLFKSDASDLESAWLDEALAHFAEDAVGRAEAGYADLRPVNVADLLAMDPNIQSAFFIQNLARSKIYLTDPTSGAPISSEAKVGRDLAYRGAAWAFLRYAVDWFSNDNPRAITRRLAFGPDTGVVNITTQTQEPLDTLLSRWLLTIAVDTSFTGVPSQFRYRSYDWREVLARVDDGSGNGNNYTLPVHSLGSTATLTATFPGTSGAFFLASQTATGPRTINVVPSTDTTGRVYILRVR
jgi:hypothetical protein